MEPINHGKKLKQNTYRVKNKYNLLCLRPAKTGLVLQIIEFTMPANPWHLLVVPYSVVFIQLGTHFQAVAVQVTLAGTPVTILSVNTPISEYLKSKDLPRLIRGLNGHILITRDVNGQNYSWGSLNNDTMGDVIERFTDCNSLCILNDGSHTYLKQQAQHSQNPTSAIDLPICTSLLDVHGRFSLTHIIATTIQSLYPWPLILETQTRGMILATRCFQRLAGSNFQSHVWTRSQLISSMTKTPSPNLLPMSLMVRKTTHPGQLQSLKSVTIDLTKGTRKYWRPSESWTERSTEGGLGYRHACP